MNMDTNAEMDSTPMDDSIAEVNNGQTEDAMLADIVRNSDFVGSLPDEQVPELDPEESDEQDPIPSEEADSEEVEEEVEEEEANTEEEDADDESATDEPDVYATEDLDLEAKVVVKVDGEFAEVSFGDLIKGYSTEQHLSKKGRELGDARKELEEEYQTKVEELGVMSKASAAVLYSNEQALASEYHEIETQIEKARKEGDTYEVSELKDKREQAQKNYWTARKQREGLVEQISKQEQATNEGEWKEQLEYFNETIPTLIPDFNEETAGAIRAFAIEEGISPEVLDSIADPIIVKFVDDYRRLKQGVTKGAVKRKSTPTKKAPLRKAKSVNKQKEDAREATRRRTLSGQASPEEEKDFLRSLAERSLNL
tara:strand:+ start:6685 stop:7791 length:1107 start_codon:yes stop_codon:yes gene_type:complete